MGLGEDGGFRERGAPVLWAIVLFFFLLIYFTFLNPIFLE